MIASQAQQRNSLVKGKKVNFDGKLGAVLFGKLFFCTDTEVLGICLNAITQLTSDDQKRLGDTNSIFLKCKNGKQME